MECQQVQCHQVCMKVKKIKNPDHFSRAMTCDGIFVELEVGSDLLQPTTLSPQIHLPGLLIFNQLQHLTVLTPHPRLASQGVIVNVHAPITVFGTVELDYTSGFSPQVGLG